MVSRWDRRHSPAASGCSTGRVDRCRPAAALAARPTGRRARAGWCASGDRHTSSIDTSEPRVACTETGRAATRTRPRGDACGDRGRARRRVRDAARLLQPRRSPGAQRSSPRPRAPADQPACLSLRRSCHRVPGRRRAAAVPRHVARAGLARRAHGHRGRVGCAVRRDHGRAGPALRRARVAVGDRHPGAPLRVPELGRLRDRRTPCRALRVPEPARPVVGCDDRARRRDQALPRRRAPGTDGVASRPRRPARRGTTRGLGGRRVRRAQPAVRDRPPDRLVVVVCVPGPP